MLIRVVVSASMVVYLLRQIAIADVATVLGRGFREWPLLAVAATLPAAGLFISGLRWQLLLSIHGKRAVMRSLFSALLVGCFFNQFLPTTIGGDVARSRWTSSLFGSRLVSLTVVGVDRILGLVGVCAVGAAAALAGASVVDRVPGLWILASAAVVGVAGLAASASLAIAWVAKPAGRRRFPAAAGPKVQLVWSALTTFGSKKRRLALAVLLSIALQVVIVIQYFALTAALGVHVSLWNLSIIVSVVTLISLAPISINGIGLRENALIVLGAPVGLSANAAAAIGALCAAILLGYGLAGGVIYMRSVRQGA